MYIGDRVVQRTTVNSLRVEVELGAKGGRNSGIFKVVQACATNIQRRIEEPIFLTGA
jgi:hypothetical protein